MSSDPTSLVSGDTPSNLTSPVAPISTALKFAPPETVQPASPFAAHPNLDRSSSRQLQLFRFNYDTFTRNHLEALVDEIDNLADQDEQHNSDILWQESPPEPTSFALDGDQDEDDPRPISRSSKRIRLSPSDERRAKSFVPPRSAVRDRIRKRRRASDSQLATSSSSVSALGPLADQSNPPGPDPPILSTNVANTSSPTRHGDRVASRLLEAQELMDRIRSRPLDRSITSASTSASTPTRDADGPPIVRAAESVDDDGERYDNLAPLPDVHANLGLRPRNTTPQHAVAAATIRSVPSSTSASSTIRESPVNARRHPSLPAVWSQPAPNVSSMRQTSPRKTLRRLSAAEEVDTELSATVQSRLAASAGASLRRSLASQQLPLTISQRLPSAAQSSAAASPSPNVSARHFATAPLSHQSFTSASRAGGNANQLGLKRSRVANNST